MTNPSILFATQAYQYLRRQVNASGGIDAGEVEVKTFPDTERYQRIVTPVDHRHVALIGGTISDADTL